MKKQEPIINDLVEMTNLCLEKDRIIGVYKRQIERLVNAINLCEKEMNTTIYTDMNNFEKWKTKMKSFIDILKGGR